MTKAYSHIIVLFIALLPLATHAQTMQFNMEIEPELSVEVLQDLNFGTVVTNSGTLSITKGDSRMGIFKMKALATQSAILRLQKPAWLTSEQTDVAIPLTLEAAYAAEQGNSDGAAPLLDGYLHISMNTPEQGSANNSVWQTGYIYIYGSLEVGDIPPGAYSAPLVLSVVYE